MSNLNSGDHRISRAPMTILCGSCGLEKTMYPQSIRHVAKTPQCPHCGWRGWLDIINETVRFGAPAKAESNDL